MDDLALRDRLRQYVQADEPPLRLTKDDVLSGGRRSRRRALAATWCAGVAAVVSITAAVALLPGVLADRPDDLVVAGSALDPEPFCQAAQRSPGPVTTPSFVANPKTGGMIPVPEEPGERAQARLTCHLMRLVGSRLPDARFELAAHVPARTVPLQAWRTQPDEAIYTATATVLDQHGAGTIAFSLRAADPIDVANTVVSCQGPPPGHCALTAGPHGEQVVALTPRPDDETGAFSFEVTVYSGQMAIAAIATNYDTRLIPAEGWPVPKTRPEPPLTADQLIAIALSPQLTLFP